MNLEVTNKDQIQIILNNKMQQTGHQIDIGINTTTAIDNGEKRQCIITQDTINIRTNMHKKFI